MYKKISSTTFFILILSLIFQGSAHSAPTKWARVEDSMSDLLNSGWQLMGVSSNRAAYTSTFGPGGFDEITYVFSLTKGGRYIVCFMPNPDVPIAKTGCRSIN